MTVPSRSRESGFVLMEVVLALMLFAMVGVALLVALEDVGNIAYRTRKEAQITRILDSKLRKEMSVPQLEEIDDSESLEEMGVDLQWKVEPIEELENEEGRLLQQMYRIEVTAYWWDNGVEQEQTVETWRYARLYQP